MRRSICIASIITVCIHPAFAAPDEQSLGKAQGYPIGNIRTWSQPQFRIGSWSAPQKIEGFANSRVEKSNTPVAVPQSTLSNEIRYSFNQKEYTVDQYLDRQKVTSLLLLKDGKLLLERYQYDRTPDARFFSYSMAKSITAILVGVASDKGIIKSLDDPSETYSPTLRGTSYGTTSVRNLLRMASGVDFVENYSGNDDVAKLSRSVITGSPSTAELFKSFARSATEGQRFNYSSLETMAIGYMLRDVTGKTITELTKDWLWNPLGAEDEAYWLLSKEGVEGAYCCFAASPRDWAKVGLLFAQNGSMNGRSIVSSEFMLQATSVDQLPSSLKARQGANYAGYGYQTWLLSGKGRQFALRGTYGQSIFVQADTGLVMVHTAAFPNASASEDPAPYDEMLSLWQGVVKSLGQDK